MSSTDWSVFVIKALESGICYTATLYSALDGAVYPIGAVEADADGSWKLPMGRPPVYNDWVLGSADGCLSGASRPMPRAQ